MDLKRLQIENYRNIETCDVSFEKGVNLLLGKNAQGKTNAVECIYTFARGKSFRGATDQQLVRRGQSGFYTAITFSNKEREQTLSYEFDGVTRKRERNGIPLKKQAEMLGHFRAVLFFPEHLQIVKAGPSERREFLNVAIAQNDPLYIGWYGEYNKILENRNILLKQAQKGMYVEMEELSAWSCRLAEVAAKIYCRRQQYIEGLTPYATDILKDISGGKETLSLSYSADVVGVTEAEVYQKYLAVYEESLSKEMQAGFSLWGIHRDDLVVTLNGFSAKDFGSQGQQRSCVLALKMAEGEYSKSQTGEYPVFLFDDVLSELDATRRSYVLGDIGERQFILTACEENIEKQGYHEITVEGGRYVSAHR